MESETITYSYARQNLAKVMEACTNDSMPYIIKGRRHRVVMVPFDDWSAEQETAHLLNNPTMAEHLRKSIGELECGEQVSMSLDEFNRFMLDDED